MGEGQKKGGKRGKKDRAGPNLGRSIIRQQFPGGPAAHAADAGVLETERGKHKLRSVTQCNDLEELMTNATLAGTDFTAKRGEMLVLGSEARQEGEKRRAPVDVAVAIPRRPAWRKGISSGELDALERSAFLDWRRQLVTIEEEKGYLLTPFEKNLEVWRQLWRVVERSKLVVQIVDARNPLLFRSLDLERYVREVDPHKRVLLLVNKADLLSDAQRKCWADYFINQGINFAFWSAIGAQQELERLARYGRNGFDPRDHADEGRDGTTTRQAADHCAQDGQQKIVQAAKQKEENDVEDASDEDEDDDEDEEAMLLRMGGCAKSGTASRLEVLEREMICTYSEGESDESAEEAENVGNTESKEDMALGIDSIANAATANEDQIRVLSRRELLTLLWQACPEGNMQADGSRVRTVGLVGYPNVGKSSTVNVLVAEKKTNVSSTPGKTKHFQTLFVPDAPSLVLCDCPGLVFPSVASSKGQMVCDGILPIDQLRDYMEPMRALMERLPVEYLERKYTLRIRSQQEREDDPDAPELAREVLVAHALARGYMTATHGVPDEARSARVILKDLVNAKLLHATPPPTATDVGEASEFIQLAENSKLPKAPTVNMWYNKIRDEYDAQEKAGGHVAGGKKRVSKVAQGAQWRPASLGTVPDRLVAQGPRVV